MNIRAKNRFNTKIFQRFFIVGLFLIVSVGIQGCFSPQKNNLIISASPSSAADDLVYFADSSGKIHALRSDGQTLWEYSLAGDLRKGEIGDIRIERLFAKSDKKLFGLARVETGGKTGDMILFLLDGNRLKWSQDSPQPEPNGSPIVIGDKTLYLAGNDGKLYAFAIEDGRLLWQYQVSLGRIGSPSLGADGVIYISGANHNLHAVDANGKQLWTAETNPQ